MDNDTATEANELQVHPLKEEQDMLLRKILALPRLKSAIWSEVWRLLHQEYDGSISVISVVRLLRLLISKVHLLPAHWEDCMSY